MIPAPAKTTNAKAGRSGGPATGNPWLTGLVWAAFSLCLLAELEVFRWTYPLDATAIRVSEPGVYSVELSRAPFGIPGLRFVSGDREGKRPQHLHTRGGVSLLEDGQEQGPAHVPLERLGLGGGRFDYFGRTLYFTSSDGSDPTEGTHAYALRAPIAPDRPITIGLLLAALWLAPDTARRRPLRPASPARRAPAEEVAVFVASLGLAAGYTALHPALSIPHGPLVAGVGYADASFWEDAASVFAAGGDYHLPHRPGYPILLGAARALTTAGPQIALALNLVAFAGTALLVFKIGFALFGRGAGFVAAGMLHCDVLRLGYVQVPNTDTIGCFLFAGFVHLAIALLCGRPRARLWWLVLGLWLGSANLVKTLTLPAVGAIAALVPFASSVRGARAKGLAIALVLAGVAGPLVPWNLHRMAMFGKTELGEKSAISLLIGSSPTLTQEGNVDRELRRAEINANPEDPERLEKAFDNIVSYPGAYLANIAQATHKSLDVLHFGAYGSFFALCVAFGLAMGCTRSRVTRWRTAWLLSGGAFFAVLTWSLLHVGLWLPVAILFAGAVRRPPLLAFLLLVGAPLLLTSLLGMGGYDRQLLSVSWAYPLFAVGSVFVGVEAIAARAGASRRPEFPHRSAFSVDPGSHAIAGLGLAITLLGCVFIAAGAPLSSPAVGRLAMSGKQRIALPVQEQARRAAGLRKGPAGSCDPAPSKALLREARTRFAEELRRDEGIQLSCVRIFTGQHLYRIHEGQRDIWHQHEPVFFDRRYARTLMYDGALLRIDGLLEPEWENRLVNVIGVASRRGEMNVLLMEEVSAGFEFVSKRRIAIDPRHIRATVQRR